MSWLPPSGTTSTKHRRCCTFSGQPPQNANLDPILYTELPFFATYEVNKLTSCMPGVWHFGFVDMVARLSHFAAANHNGMLRICGSSAGAAPTRKNLSGAQTRRTVPAQSGTGRGRRLVDQSSINYAETGVLTALELTAKFHEMVVENCYKSRRTR